MTTPNNEKVWTLVQPVFNEIDRGYTAPPYLLYITSEDFQAAIDKVSSGAGILGYTVLEVGATTVKQVIFVGCGYRGEFGIPEEAKVWDDAVRTYAQEYISPNGTIAVQLTRKDEFITSFTKVDCNGQLSTVLHKLLMDLRRPVEIMDIDLSCATPAIYLQELFLDEDPGQFTLTDAHGVNSVACPIYPDTDGSAASDEHYALPG